MAQSNELVSVVIPIYNSEKFLQSSIESVLNQTYKNVEIIAVNDGSTDNSVKILEEYSDRIIIISQPNQGLASALNTGIRQMKGKWFKWFSPDDILYPNAIEVLVAEAKKQDENSIIYSNWELIDVNGKKVGDFFESNYNDLKNFDYNIRLLNGQIINVNTTLIPCLLFDKGCTIDNLTNSVVIDYDFFLKAGILYDVHFHHISTSLIKYRIHSEQLSHKNIKNSIQSLAEVRNKILSNLEDSIEKKYLKALQDYNKNKPITKKTMNFALKFITGNLPDWATDNLVTFYLNRIRRTR